MIPILPEYRVSSRIAEACALLCFGRGALNINKSLASLLRSWRHLFSWATCRDTSHPYGTHDICVDDETARQKQPKDVQDRVAKIFRNISSFNSRENMEQVLELQEVTYRKLATTSAVRPEPISVAVKGESTETQRLINAILGQKILKETYSTFPTTFRYDGDLSPGELRVRVNFLNENDVNHFNTYLKQARGPRRSEPLLKMNDFLHSFSNSSLGCFTDNDTPITEALLPKSNDAFSFSGVCRYRVRKGANPIMKLFDAVPHDDTNLPTYFDIHFTGDEVLGTSGALPPYLRPRFGHRDEIC